MDLYADYPEHVIPAYAGVDRVGGQDGHNSSCDPRVRGGRPHTIAWSEGDAK
mgnify:CR=1 FL=1